MDLWLMIACSRVVFTESRSGRTLTSNGHCEDVAPATLAGSPSRTSRRISTDKRRSRQLPGAAALLGPVYGKTYED